MNKNISEILKNAILGHFIKIKFMIPRLWVFGKWFIHKILKKTQKSLHDLAGLRAGGGG